MCDKDPIDYQTKLNHDRQWRERNAQTQAPMQPGAQIGGQAGCARPYDETDILAEFFRYHPPTAITIPKFAAVNQAAKNFAEVVLQNCPPGSDRTGAINIIRTARMVANQAIALDGLTL
jgi:hypothetical protein